MFAFWSALIWFETFSNRWFDKFIDHKNSWHKVCLTWQIETKDSKVSIIVIFGVWRWKTWKLRRTCTVLESNINSADVKALVSLIDNDMHKALSLRSGRITLDTGQNLREHTLSPCIVHGFPWKYLSWIWNTKLIFSSGRWQAHRSCWIATQRTKDLLASLRSRR